MQMNRSTDYAIRILVYLAKMNTRVSSSKLAAAIGVSPRYLLQISVKLRAAGFIQAAHGPSGGFELMKAPEEISLYDVIVCMEGAAQVSRSKKDQLMKQENEEHTLGEILENIDLELKNRLKKINIKMDNCLFENRVSLSFD